MKVSVGILVLVATCMSGQGRIEAEVPKVAQTLRIDAPASDSEVQERTHVRFTPISIPSGFNFIILINPEATSSKWWVQRKPEATGEGLEWSALCHFGSAGKGRGEPFRILVVATRKSYKEGDELPLDVLPKNAIRSKILTVYRAK